MARGDNNRKHVNHHALDDLSDINVQYWLGYIAGDGCIDHKTNRISLVSKDKYIIDDFKQFVDSHHNIYTYHNKKQNTYSYRLSFCSAHMSSHLISVGITPRKSKTLQIACDKLLHRPKFIQGIIDADGYVATYRPHVEIGTGSIVFSTQLEQVFCHWNIQYTMVYRDDVILARVNGESALQLLDKINYRDARFFIKRKRTAALSHLLS